MIVDAAAWVDHLPNTILAVFVKRTFHEEDWTVNEDEEEPQQMGWRRKHYTDSRDYCQRVHREFLATYELTAKDVPLLEYDPISWVREGSPPHDLLPFRDISPPDTWPKGHSKWGDEVRS